MDAQRALERIAFLLERDQAPTYRAQAFRTAAAVVAELPFDELLRRARTGRLAELRGIGPVTAQVIAQAVAGQTPDYLADLESRADPRPSGRGRELRAALRGDCHVHSDWSDGVSPIETMARTARDLGHRWIALTDHSPRLTVARGLSAERLREQIRVVAEVNERVAPLRLLTGIECDILDDGRLDQEDDLLGELDLVVASVHSKLRMGRAEMTRRLVAAAANPHTDVLGHVTGRLMADKRRPESEFDADEVFAACADAHTALEINCRPERLDPPRRLLRQAARAGLFFAADSDAHAPGELDWQIYGCDRAVQCGVPAERVINTWTAQQLRTWSRTGRAPRRSKE